MPDGDIVGLPAPGDHSEIDCQLARSTARNMEQQAHTAPSRIETARPEPTLPCAESRPLQSRPSRSRDSEPSESRLPMSQGVPGAYSSLDEIQAMAGHSSHTPNAPSRAAAARRRAN